MKHLLVTSPVSSYTGHEPVKVDPRLAVLEIFIIFRVHYFKFVLIFFRFLFKFFIIQ